MEIITILCNLYSLILVFYLLQFLIQALQELRCYLRGVFQPKGKTSKSFRTDPRNRELQAELLTLLQWDYATAKRLLRLLRQQHPGKTDNWYLEKAIDQLLRDRRFR